MFKKLVYKIAAIKTEGDRNECFAEIDCMFNRGKINWEDHEVLYKLAEADKIAVLEADERKIN
jgi:hypothetical protein